MHLTVEQLLAAREIFEDVWASHIPASNSAYPQLTDVLSWSTWLPLISATPGTGGFASRPSRLQSSGDAVGQPKAAQLDVESRIWERPGAWKSPGRSLQSSSGYQNYLDLLEVFSKSV